MGQWWKYALRLIAIIAAAAPAAMNVAGCFESLTNPYLKYGAVGVGSIADIYLLASLPALAYFRHKRRKWKFRVGLAFWLACTLWTGLSSGSWLHHKLEAAQAPVERTKQAQARTEADRQNDIASERETLKGEAETARTGNTKEIRDNARRLAAETRGRIKALEDQKASPVPAEDTPVKSPFSGYETLVTFLLLAFSQGCWFMALDEEPEAEIGTARQPEMATGNDAPAPPRKRRKQAGNGDRKAAGNEEGAQILKFRKPPTREEILAFVDRNLANGNGKWEGAEERFGYTIRHLRNFLNEKPRSQAA